MTTSRGTFRLGALVLVASACGCASVLGLGGLEPVDCVGDECPVGPAADGAADRSAPSPEASVDATAPGDACGACPGNGAWVFVTLRGDGLRLTSDPGGLSLGGTQPMSGGACFSAGRVRFDLSGGASATGGVKCEFDECELDVVGGDCVDAVLTAL